MDDVTDRLDNAIARQRHRVWEPNQGASDDWFTPPEIFAVHGPTFDLDPCSPPAPATTRRRIYTKADDGLKLGPHQLLVPARRLGRIRRGRRLIDRS